MVTEEKKRINLRVTVYGRVFFEEKKSTTDPVLVVCGPKGF